MAVIEVAALAVCVVAGVAHSRRKHTPAHMGCTLWSVHAAP